MQVNSQISDRRTLGPWFIIEGIHSYGVTLFCYGCYFYASEVLRATDTQCLWLSAGWGFFYIFLSLLSGHLAARWGSRNMIAGMSAGCVITAAGGLVVLHFQNIWVLFAVMAAYNFTNTQIWPALESALTRSPGRMKLSSRISRFNVVWSVSSSIAYFTSGPIMNLGWSLVFLIPAACALIATFLSLGWSVPQDQLATDHITEDSLNLNEEAGGTPRRRAGVLLLMAWTSNMLAYTAMNVIIPVMPFLTRLAAPGAGIWTASLGSVWGFARFGGFLLSLFWMGWRYRARWMLAAYVLLCTGFAMVLLSPGNLTALLGGQALFGLGAAFVYAGSLTYAMHLSSGSSGHAGIHEALIGMGITMGPAVGALAGNGSRSLPNIAGAVLSLLGLGALVLFVFWYRGRSEGNGVQV